MQLITPPVGPLALGRTVPDPRHFHGHRADPGLDLPLGQVPVPDKPLAASGISLTGMGGEKRIEFRLDRLSNQITCPLAQQIRQRIR
jgi:hypothetical protein